MILQALVSCYEALAAKGKLERPGWLEAKVSWGLELNEDGTLRQIVPLGLPDKKGKTTVTAMKLPVMEKRTVGIKRTSFAIMQLICWGLTSRTTSRVP